MRRLFVSLFAAAVLAAPMAAVPSETLAQRSVVQDGLVNVAVGDVVIRDVQVAVIGQVVANLCPGVDVENIAVLAADVDQTGGQQTVICTATGAPITITQNNPGQGQGTNNRPPGQVDQDGLVNVAIGDVVLRDISIAAAVQAVANVCPAVDVENVALLAAAVDQTGAPQNVNCTATGAPITITQNLPGRGQ